MKYLFSEWSALNKKLKNRQIFLFLDYDGTLCPVAKIPEGAILPSRIKRLIDELSKINNIKIAIISGRSLEDIKKMTGINNVFYAGNHGLEIEGPNTNFRCRTTPMYNIVIDCLKNKLSSQFYPIRGALVEDKGITISVHYRLVDKKHRALVKRIFFNAVASYVHLKIIKISSGKKVFEIKPLVNWNKGKCVLWLLKKIKNAVPFYIGDDLTDEDAFKAIRKIGYAICVGKQKISHAQYYVKNTSEVSIFLKKILLLKGDLCRT